MGLWSRNKKQTKPISVSLDDLSKTKNTPTLQIGSIKGTRSFQHLDSIKYSQKESNPYKFADESFQRISSLGSGAYSTVTKVLHYPTNTIMAKKIIKIGSKEDSNSLSETQILRELNILAKCQCNYIVTYYGTFISNHQINIMMEYMDIGSLEYIIKKLGAVPMPPMKTITLHSLRGLLYLEEQGIIHRGIC
jgi:serine/threonine protein kinase